MSKKFMLLFGRTLFVMTLFAVLGAAPAFAEEAVPAAPAVAAAPAPDQPGCGQTLDLAAALSAKAQICPATVDQTPAPDFVGGRTCRCSCGFPCKTDADCGGGEGSCRAGITCC